MTINILTVRAIILKRNKDKTSFHNHSLAQSFKIYLYVKLYAIHTSSLTFNYVEMMLFLTTVSCNN